MELMTKEQRTKKIETAEKMVREAEALRTASLTMKEQYEKDLKVCEDELVKLGTTPDKVEEKIREVALEMDSLLKEIEENLPLELLRKMGKI